ncbi:MAG TPA: hypothetical protein EYH34_12680 [Planctomycetes bacterium]|nr:hypothetical protein [Planctomycetota bacterium]
MGLPNWGHLVYADGVVLYGANAAYDAATGGKLWQISVSPGKLPVVHGDRIITSAFAYDLRTGRQYMTEDLLTGRPVAWQYARAYGCGPITGCRHVLFFRSGADGFFDMEADGTTNFGGVRSGCARTLLAANGLLIHTQGYSGCGCSYNYKTNLALIASADWRHVEAARGGGARPGPAPVDRWYVLPRRSRRGLIKRLAVNFGAPGDRRDRRGRAWLGFPRPLLDTACPAPLALSMSRAECLYRRRITEAIRDTDVPWVYSSALYGQGRMAIDLALSSGIVLLDRRSDPAPRVDGALDEACWKNVPPVPFKNSPFSMLGARTDFRLFRDAQSIYFGYRCRPAAGALTGSEEDEADPSADKLEIFLADGRRRTGIHLIVRRDGRGSATFGTVASSRKIDPQWNGRWQWAVRSSAEGWTAEVALPIETLRQSGMDLERLQLNAMAQSRRFQPRPAAVQASRLRPAAQGAAAQIETVFLTDPRYGTKFQSCLGFLELVSKPAAQPKRRRFSLRLHFAEMEDIEPGRRVFDVVVQGKKVLDGLDVIRQAGGRFRPLVEEIHNVEATDRMVIDLQPSGGDLPPFVCGVELVEQQ